VKIYIYAVISFHRVKNNTVSAGFWVTTDRIQVCVCNTGKHQLDIRTKRMVFIRASVPNTRRANQNPYWIVYGDAVISIIQPAVLNATISGWLPEENPKKLPCLPTWEKWLPSWTQWSKPKSSGMN